MIRLVTYRTFCNQTVRPYESLPRPKQRALVGSGLDVMRKYGRTQTHKLLMDRVKELGKIFYDKMFTFKSVNIAEPNMIAALFRNEGKYPKRITVPIWFEPRRNRGIPLAVLLAEDEDWYRMRRAIDKQLLTLPNIYKYIEPMNGIADDFIKLFLKNDENALKDLVFRWSTESVCAFLYDTRIGCLSENPPANALKFAYSVQAIFHTSNKLFMFSPRLAKFLMPLTYRQHEKAWYDVFDIGKIYMDQKLADLKAKIENNEPVDGFLASLITNDKISHDEAFSITVELMGGGVDTTATTLLWLLHLLAENVDKQERLFEEIRSAGISDGSPITEDYIRRAPYLKACLKEAMRMRPIILGTSRLIPEDTVLNGYSIPKGTPIIALNIVTSNSEEYYPNPNMYTPERWLQKTVVNDKSNVSRFSSLPFGFGPRGCVGRRLAELEIYILIAKIVSQYRIVSLNGGLVEQDSQMIVAPKTPIKIKLEKRL